MDEIVGSLDEQYSTDEFFTSIYSHSWGAMCSYTHSGALQLARRFTGDELKPDYSEGAIVEALNLVTLALLLLMHMFFVSMRCQKEDEETQTLLRQYSVDFADRIRGGQYR